MPPESILRVWQPCHARGIKIATFDVSPLRPKANCLRFYVEVSVALDPSRHGCPAREHPSRAIALVLQNLGFRLKVDDQRVGW